MSLVIKGKSKKVFNFNDNLLKIIYTDSISCFNSYRCDIKNKGKILNIQNAWWMKKTKNIVDNHYLSHYDNTLIVKKCKRIDIEVVVRNYYTGSITKKGELEKYGLTLPKDIVKNSKFSKPIITPTTKDDFDLPLKERDIYEKKLATQEDWEKIKTLALKLFNYGSKIMEKKGIILVDTKYEFGYDEKGNIILIDELHTSDSSRFWDKNMKNFDKDILRNFVQDNPGKDIPDDIKDKILSTYTSLYRLIVLDP